ncbi:MAG: type II toxin-antitoxin system HicA family toxin [Defluviitaleaceae bacterium]|nr:type II toxin-antitoxin system HicA family toxin [Defluviitaleaceae bacterium]
MKIPRDVNARDLIKVLERYGYVFVRQEGSHIRMIKNKADKIHKITIPYRNPMKIGTFHKIAKEICIFNKLNIHDFYNQL